MKLNDNRGAKRRKTLFGGILYGSKRQARDCRVIDISLTGAKLKVPAKYSVGAKLYLRIYNRKGIHLSVIMWANDGFIGLKFLKSSGVNEWEFSKTFNLLHTIDDTANKQDRKARLRSKLEQKHGLAVFGNSAPLVTEI